MLFLIININKSLEQRMGFSTVIFETGARLKKPVYVCIWPSEWLGDLFPATELELNRFWPSPFYGDHVATHHTGEQRSSICLY